MSKDNNPFPPGSSVAGYFRDSGGDEQDLSVSRQLAEFRHWLAEHALLEGEIFSDAARPGSTIVGREAFQAMLRHFRTGAAAEAGLAIWRSNRFGRNIDDTQFYKADLRRQGYLVYSLTDHIPQDRYGKLIEFVLDWKDEEFLHALSEDVSSGLRNIVQTFGAVPGTPPRGFVREAVDAGLRRDGRPHTLHRWVPDPALAPLVRRAFEMLAHGEPLSRIHTATGLYGSLNSWITFFHNPLYKGELRFGDLVVENYCEPVVDPELWDLVQRILDRRSRRRSANTTQSTEFRDPRRAASPWLLSGLLYCARCGSPMNGHVVLTRTYYVCSRGHRRRDCDALYLRSGPLEAAVLERVRAYLADPANLAALQSERRRAYQAATLDLEPRSKNLTARLGNLGLQISRLVDAITDGHASPALMDRLTALEVQEYELREELEQLQNLTASQPAELSEADLQRLADGLGAALASSPPDEQRRALRGWVSRIEAEREGKTVRGRIELFLPPIDDHSLKKKHVLSKVEGTEMRVSTPAPHWGHLLVTLEFEAPIVRKKRDQKPL